MKKSILHDPKFFLYSLATDKKNGFIAGVIKLFLLILSLLYGIAVNLLILSSSSRKAVLKCKVISIGNITLGGTGKTMLVEYVSSFLKESGIKFAIISRGYKRTLSAVAKNQFSIAQMGDEPYMLWKKLKDVPVIVDSDRINAADKAINEYKVNGVLLDDAFQQWAIKKDLEVCVIDSLNPFGNGHLIPRGILREPLSSLKRADVFVLSKTNFCENLPALEQRLSRINSKALIVKSTHEYCGFYKINQHQLDFEMEFLRDKKVALISGIGDPHSFEKTVNSLGIDYELSFRFMDHHNYTSDELRHIVNKSEEKGITYIITTEKDAVRISDLNEPVLTENFLVLKVKLKITDNEEKFHSRLLRVFSA